MKTKTIRNLYIQDCQILADIMGFSKNALDQFAGRYVEISLKSPKRVKGTSGQTYYNGKQLEAQCPPR